MTPTERDDDAAEAEAFDRLTANARAQAMADVIADKVLEKAAMFRDLTKVAEEYYVSLLIRGSAELYPDVKAVVDRARALK